MLMSNAFIRQQQHHWQHPKQRRHSSNRRIIRVIIINRITIIIIVTIITQITILHFGQKHHSLSWTTEARGDFSLWSTITFVIWVDKHSQCLNWDCRVECFTEVLGVTWPLNVLSFCIISKRILICTQILTLNRHHSTRALMWTVISSTSRISISKYIFFNSKLIPGFSCRSLGATIWMGFLPSATTDCLHHSEILFYTWIWSHFPDMASWSNKQ